MEDEPLLRLADVHAGYGEIEVLHGVSADVRADEIVSIIGANGAGKSTLLRTVFGMVTPTGGSIRFCGEEIVGENPVAVLRRGCSYVPQGRRNFPAMSVEENLEMGAYTRRDRQVRRDIEVMMERFPVLGAKRRALETYLRLRGRSDPDPAGDRGGYIRSGDVHLRGGAARDGYAASPHPHHRRHPAGGGYASGRFRLPAPAAAKLM